MSLAFADSLRADGAFPIAAAHPNPLHAGLNAIGNHLVGHCGRGQHDYAIGDGFDIRHASEAALPLNFCSGRIHRNRVIAARAELAGISAQLERDWPQFNKGCRAVLLTDAERLHSNKLPYILMGIVGLVLLIACFNVAGLLVARAGSRRHEIGVRLALGASRLRLVGQLMAESALIGAMGTAAGLLLARVLISVLPAVIVPSGAAAYLKFQFRLDERVLAFTLLASLVTVFVFGLVPALRASQSVSRAPRRARSRQVLVVVQMVLSIVLLASAGLLVRTFVYCMNLDPGFTRGNVLVADISPPYDAAGSRAFYEKLLDRARGMPGVLEATLALRAPLSGSGGGMAQNLTISGHVPQPGDTPPRVKYTAIGLNYFRTLGISLARGRDFDSHDQPDAARVIIVNFTMARQFWPNEDALGKTARLASDPPNTERTVVGVVSDTRINSIEERAQPYFYLPFAQSRFSSMNLIARTSVDPVQMARQVRAEVAAIDRGVPVLEITSMKLLLRSALYEPQVSATIVGSLGLIGLLLAASLGAEERPFSKDDPTGRSKANLEFFGPISPAYLDFKTLVARQEVARWAPTFPKAGPLVRRAGALGAAGAGLVFAKDAFRSRSRWIMAVTTALGTPMSLR